jgi:transcriptional regulator of acetoin/glycerol metabolism
MRAQLRSRSRSLGVARHLDDGTGELCSCRHAGSWRPRNACESGVCETDGRIHLAFDVSERRISRKNFPTPESYSHLDCCLNVLAWAPAKQGSKIIPLADLEKAAILGAIGHLKGDKLLAAKMLGIGKTTLYRKLKEYASQM